MRHVGQAELKKEVEKWAVPLEKISQQVTEVNDAAKRTYYNHPLPKTLGLPK
jgi:hypothetical protein